MNSQTAQILVLVAALIAVVVGVSLSRTVGTGVWPRSSKLFICGGLLVMLGAAATLGLGVESPILLGTALGMLLVGSGQVAQAKELAVFSRFAEGQRVDIVSGLPNERLFFERLAAEHSRTKRTSVPYSIAIFEIDGHASFSDRDQLNGMKLLAESLGESIRKTDSLGRIGSRKVAVLLVDTLAEGALIGCERACERFFFQSCGHHESAHVTRPMTLSVGVASFQDDTVDPHQVVENAKLALVDLQGELRSGMRIYERNEFARNFAADEGALVTISKQS